MHFSARYKMRHDTLSVIMNLPVIYQQSTPIALIHICSEPTGLHVISRSTTTTTTNLGFCMVLNWFSSSAPIFPLSVWPTYFVLPIRNTNKWAWMPNRQNVCLHSHICLVVILTSDLENLFSKSHSHEEYLHQVSLKSLY